MIAMRDEEAMLMIAVFAAGVFIVWMSLRHSLRREQLKTIQRVMESGNMDATTRNQLIEVLSNDTRRSQQYWQWLLANTPRILRGIVVIVGWLTFVISSVVMLGMVVGDAHYYDIVGASVGMGVGFALLTLPLALREVEARRSVARD